MMAENKNIWIRSIRERYTVEFYFIRQRILLGREACCYGNGTNSFDRYESSQVGFTPSIKKIQVQARGWDLELDRIEFIRLFSSTKIRIRVPLIREYYIYMVGILEFEYYFDKKCSFTLNSILNSIEQGFVRILIKKYKIQLYVGVPRIFSILERIKREDEGEKQNFRSGLVKSTNLVLSTSKDRVKFICIPLR